MDYGVEFALFGKKITQGQLANFYRLLETEHASLAEALVSQKSINFLGVHEFQIMLIDNNLFLTREGFFGTKTNKFGNTEKNGHLESSGSLLSCVGLDFDGSGIYSVKKQVKRRT